MKLSELNQNHIRRLHSYALDETRLQGVKVLEFAPGEYPCREKEAITYLMIVISGTAKVYYSLENGKRLLLSFYESGGMIGDLELMLNWTEASAGVQAASVFRCIGIPIRANSAYVRSNISFLNMIGESLARKLDRLSGSNARIIFYPLEARLCSYIDGSCVEGVFDEKLTEVAEVIGTSYRHLLRSLNGLVQEGILEKRKHSYLVVREEELKKRGRNFYKPVEKSSEKIPGYLPGK